MKADWTMDKQSVGVIMIFVFAGHLYVKLENLVTFSLCFPAVDFFNQVNLLYGTLTEFCTAESCPTMTAGPK